MGESKKTKQQLMEEITRLRNCVAESMTGSGEK